MSSNLSSDCQLAAEVVLQPYAQFSRCLLLLLNLSSFLAFVPFIRDYARKRVTLHGNLKLIFLNMALIYGLVGPSGYFLVEFRNLLVSIVHSDSPCQMRVQLWYILGSKTVVYWYALSTPLLHFALMVERARATAAMGRYEAQGRTFGALSLLATYSVVAVFVVFLVYTALLANQFDLAKQCAANILTNQYNQSALLILSYLHLTLVFATAVGDFLVMRANKARQQTLSDFKRIGSVGYSLSENFQLRENLHTIRLIFPLDLAYFALSSLYMVGVCIVRTALEHSQIDVGTFMAHYNLLVCLPTLYNTVALFYFHRFLVVKHRRKGGNKIGAEADTSVDQAKVYFSELMRQWN